MLPSSFFFFFLIIKQHAFVENLRSLCVIILYEWIHLECLSERMLNDCAEIGYQANTEIIIIRQCLK